jgi:hypothetical protein
MSKNIEIKKTWKTLGGLDVTLTGTLRLEKTVDLDGDICPVDCCEIDIVIHVDQKGYQWGSVKPLAINHPAVKLGRSHIIGELALTFEQASLIASVRAELEAHPAWVAKQAAIAKNRAEIAKMESNRGFGYCKKCHTYCYGDCQA